VPAIVSFQPLHSAIQREVQNMNRNPIANTPRRQLGACVCLRASDARVSHGVTLMGFGGASPGPGSGGAS
jgi:hypothetical protein